jgi:hypothetical protein
MLVDRGDKGFELVVEPMLFADPFKLLLEPWEGFDEAEDDESKSTAVKRCPIIRLVDILLNLDVPGPGNRGN